MSDKVQISEKQAREMLNSIIFCSYSPWVREQETIAYWSKSGYIKQSKLEEAREFYTLASAKSHISGVAIAIHDYYEAAIAELLEDKSNG